MKKLMILGAGVYQLPLVKYASKKCYVILVAPKISDNFIELSDKVYYKDLRNEKEILEIAKQEKIDGIITDQTDIPVRTVAYVAQEMGIPGNSYDTACLFTDKNKMRNRLKELNLPYIPYKNVTTFELAKEAAIEIGYPVIIKPVDNQGSRGIYKIDNENELKDRFDLAISVSPSRQVIVEKYVFGKEAVVEGAVVDYKYNTLICGDTIYFDIKDSFAAKKRSFPSQLPNNIQKKILDLNKSIIEGFGLKQGITHSEFIIDGDEIYLIETAARGGGVFISSDLIYLRTGICTEEFLVDLALGNPVEIKKEDKPCVCCYIAFYLPPYGKVLSIDGIETVKSFPFVYNNILDTVSVGMKTKKAEDKTSRFSIIVSGKNFVDLEENIKKIKNTIDIKVETAEGIKFPIWD